MIRWLPHAIAFVLALVCACPTPLPVQPVTDAADSAADTAPPTLIDASPDAPLEASPRPVDAGNDGCGRACTTLHALCAEYPDVERCASACRAFSVADFKLSCLAGAHTPTGITNCGTSRCTALK